MFLCGIYIMDMANTSYSPFGKSNSTFVLYLEPVLNSYYQTYQNIITISTMPPGPLADMVTMINLPKLSPFQEAGPFSGPNRGFGCTHVLLRYPKSACGVSNVLGKNTDVFMGADDIPSVLGYLKTNGYTVDTSLTKMMFQGPIKIGGASDQRFSGDRKMICFASI
jgi:hypothetical protein